MCALLIRTGFIKGYQSQRSTLLNKHFATLELLLRFGVDAHRAAVLPKMAGAEWSGEESEVINRIRDALKVLTRRSLLSFTSSPITAASAKRKNLTIIWRATGAP